MTAFSGSGGFGGDFFAGYKHIYNPKAVAKLAFRNHKLLDKLTKKDCFEGDTYNHSIFYADPQGVSADLATAIAQKQASSRGIRMTINRGRLYGAISIYNEEIRASRSDAGSLLRKKSTETNGVIATMMNAAEEMVLGGGNGVIASFTSTTNHATTTITLDSPQSGVRFSQGMNLQLATNNLTNGTPNTLLNGGASVRVTAVSRGPTTSTLTVDTQLLTAFPSIANSTQYFLTLKGGNLGFGLNSFAGGVSGFKSWFPATAVTAGDSFWGADRSVDAESLGGARYDASAGEKYETTFQNASAQLALNGSNPDIVVCSYIDAAKFSQEMGNKVRLGPTSAATTGLSPMRVEGLSGTMELVPSARIEPGLFYMLDTSTVWLPTLDAMPHLVDDDGSSSRREATVDANEMRWRAWFNVVCDAPKNNLRGTFAA